MKEKTFERWTRKDFESLPDISELNEKPEIADSLVILPTRRLHDSGYRIMHFAVIVNNKPATRCHYYWESDNAKEYYKQHPLSDLP